MQIQFERDALLKPIGFVASAVERRSTLPILAHILVTAADGKATLTGTDLEVEILATVPGTVQESGDITVPAKKLFDICRALPEGANISLSTHANSRALIKSGKSRFSLSTLPSTDFPKIDASKYEQVLTIEASVLRRLVAYTAFCMAQQDVRYFLNGLYLEVSSGQMRAVATDGHRMAIADCESPKGVSSSTQVIVPRKAVQELARLLASDDGQVVLSFSQNRVRIEASGAVITSKLIDGKFPDYTKVVPKNQSKRIQLNRDRFREALGRAAILANEKYKGVKLGLQAGSLQISAHNPDQEEAVEEVETEYKGEPLEIGFNVTYLLEATNALTSDEIVLGLNDPNSSCTIQSTGEAGVQYVVMPMRL